jgi:rubredoxin
MSLPLLGDPLIFLIILITIASLIYHYRVPLLLRLRIRPYEASTEGKQRYTKVIEGRECPKCGKAMEEGYLIGPQGIYWSKNAPLYSLGFIGRGLGIPGAEPLSLSYYFRGMRTHCFKAYRCQRCGVVQVELGEQQPFEI